MVCRFVRERGLQVDVSVSQITRMELLARRGLDESDLRGINAFLRRSTVVLLSSDVERHAVQIRRDLRVKLPDAIIAATAQVLGCPLVTGDKDLARKLASQVHVLNPQAPVDRDYLTQRYTEETLRFITENRDRPFFIYLPHAMPGSTDRPFSSPAFQGKSANGPYGDSVEEMDWSTGEILATLDRLGLDDNTLVVWTSDNGAIPQNPHQGSNAPLKGRGYDTSEGAMRMPCIVRWPGQVPAGIVSDEITTTMDWLPTFAHLAGTQPPEDRIIDGHDLRPLLFGDSAARSRYDATGFFYYFMDQLQAVRAGQWKLCLPLEEKRTDLGGKVAASEAALFDVRNDLGETMEVAGEHPEVVVRLLALAEEARADLGDRGRQGTGQRPAGWIDDPEPRLLAPRCGDLTWNSSIGLDAHDFISGEHHNRPTFGFPPTSWVWRPSPSDPIPEGDGRQTQESSTTALVAST